MGTSTYVVTCLSEAVSPISHMARVEGNEAIIQRQEVLTPDGVRLIPRLTGNALRHRCVRGPGARFLVDRWGLAGRLSLRQVNFLFHGGSVSESTSRQAPAELAELHRLLPLYRLLGGCLPNAILPGSLHADFGWLACRENRAVLAARCPEGCEVPDDLRPAEAFVGAYQYTRTDNARSLARPDPAGAPDADPRMIFAGQCVVPGAVFVHQFHLQHVSRLELGALLLSLALWQAGGGTVGGMAARGHGRLSTRVHAAGVAEAATPMAEYVAHVDAVRDEAVAWLDRAFETGLPAAAKGKGKRKEAARATAEGDGDAG